jgi:hypothetical protein
LAWKVEQTIFLPSFSDIVEAFALGNDNITAISQIVLWG